MTLRRGIILPIRPLAAMRTDLRLALPPTSSPVVKWTTPRIMAAPMVPFRRRGPCRRRPPRQRCREQLMVGVGVTMKATCAAAAVEAGQRRTMPLVGTLTCQPVALFGVVYHRRPTEPRPPGRLLRLGPPPMGINRACRRLRRAFHPVVTACMYPQDCHPVPHRHRQRPYRPRLRARGRRPTQLATAHRHLATASVASHRLRTVATAAGGM